MLMSDQIIVSASSLTAIAIVAFATLRGWQGWLSWKQHELQHVSTHGDAPRRGIDTEDREGGSAMGAARIEISDLKERIRKLEAIASGVDL